MVKLQYNALGTIFFFEIYHDLSKVEIEAIDTFIRSELESFEKNYSRFLDTSLLSQLSNIVKESYFEEIFQDEGVDWCKKLELITKENFPQNVEFHELIHLCGSFHLRTAKAFDIRVGGKLILQGYDQGDKFGYSQFGNDKKSSCLLDLGGIGKSYLVDKFVDMFRKSPWRLKYFLVNGGGDIYASSNPDGSPVEILLENPFDSTEYVDTTMLWNSAIASSSRIKRSLGGDADFQNVNSHIVPYNPKFQINTEIVATFAKSKHTVNADVMSKILHLTWKKQSIKGLMLGLNSGIATIDSSGVLFKSPYFDTLKHFEKKKSQEGIF